jgi:hypothetical protein
MRIKAVTSASAILGGVCMLAVGLVNLSFPSYGGDFLRMVSSIYPGLHDSRTVSEVLLGTIYGFASGAILGYMFGLLYRRASGSSGEAISPAAPTVLPGPTLRRAS